MNYVPPRVYARIMRERPELTHGSCEICERPNGTRPCVFGDHQLIHQQYQRDLLLFPVELPPAMSSEEAKQLWGPAHIVR